MSSPPERSPPFIDPDGSLDLEQLRSEAVRIAGLVVLFGGLALIPLVFVFLLGGDTALTAVFVVVAQLILAVGTGIVLIYAVARGNQLARG